VSEPNKLLIAVFVYFHRKSCWL